MCIISLEVAVKLGIRRDIVLSNLVSVKSVWNPPILSKYRHGPLPKAIQVLKRIPCPRQCAWKCSSLGILKISRALRSIHPCTGLTICADQTLPPTSNSFESLRSACKVARVVRVPSICPWVHKTRGNARSSMLPIARRKGTTSA